MPDRYFYPQAPGGVIGQIAEAADAPELWQYAPGGPIEQIRNAVDPDLVLDQHAPGGIAEQLIDELPAEGGGTPDWVPADAVIYIDLVRAFNSLDAAWTAADGIVAVDTLLGSDPNADNWTGGTRYEPSLLTANGYQIIVGDNDPPALLGTALALMVAGGTLRVQTKFTDVSLTGGGGGSYMVVSPTSADGNAALTIQLDDRTASRTLAFYSNGPIYEELESIGNVGVGEFNVIAATLINSRIEVAANGSAVIAGTLDAADKPPGNPMVAWVVDPRLNALQSITFYDALPSTAGLSELSETE